jgi:hypothetical protein
MTLQLCLIVLLVGLFGWVLVAPMNAQDIEGDPAHAQQTPTDPSVQRAASAPVLKARAGVVASLLPEVRLTPRDISGNGVDRVSLDGEWDFVHAVPPGFDGTRRSIVDWKTVNSPGHFAFQGFPRMHESEGVPVAYARMLEIPADWSGRRVVLRFEAVDGLSRIYVNGKRVGERDIACLPFEHDITDFITPGEKAELVMTVEKSLVTRWSRRELGGITRSAYLLSLPPIQLSGLHVSTSLDSDHKNATLRAGLRVENATTDTSGPLSVRLRLIGSDGTSNDLLKKPAPIGRMASGSSIEFEIPARVANPALWSAERPILYQLEAELIEGDQTRMIARQRFGFREVRVDGHQLLINGRPVKLRGTNHHITWPGLGESVPSDLMRRDLELIRDANLNTTRSRPTPAHEYAALCDEIGMYTTVEAMISLMIYDAGPKKDYGADPAIAPGLLFHVATMIESLRSHPSIIAWGLGNECPYYDYFQTAAIALGAAEPTRPIFFGSDNRLGVGIPFVDLYDDHYPRDGRSTWADPGNIVGKGWDYPDDRPNIFTEWMHVHTNNTKEIAFDRGIDDAWGYVAEAHVERMMRTPHFAGGFHFKAVPYRGVGIKMPWRGLFDDERKINDTYWHTQKAHSPVRVSDRAGKMGRTSSGQTVAEFEIENRFDFLDLAEIDLVWSHHRSAWSETGEPIRTGRVEVSLPPGERGRVSVPWYADGVTRLEARTRDGRLIDRWNLQPDGGSHSPPREPSRPSSGWSVEQETTLIRVHMDDRVVEIDRATGLIHRARVGETVVIDGPIGVTLLPAQFRNFRPQEALTLVNQLSDWTAIAVETFEHAGGLTVVSRGAYMQADGLITTTIHKRGELEIAYEFEWKQQVERPTVVFAWGLSIPVAAGRDRLNWSRDAQWTAYPPDHVGRPVGQILNTADSMSDREGSDFRATRFQIRELSLRGRDDDAGIELLGSLTADERQHSQVIPRHDDLGGSISMPKPLDGEVVAGHRLQVYRFHSGGTEPHLTKSLIFDRFEVEPGVRFGDRVRLRLVP